MKINPYLNPSILDFLSLTITFSFFTTPSHQSSNPTLPPNPRLQKAYIALQAWKHTIISDPKSFTSNWNTPFVCNYTGVYCTPALDNPNLQTVAGIDLNHADISGTLPELLGLLTDLSLFHINSNRFSGTLPESFQNLHLLYELDISNNQFSGHFPSVVLSLPSLKFLDIRFNEFEGNIPSSLFDLKLDAICIDNNHFQSSLPENIGNSPVSVLVLANNNHNGCFPASITKMGKTLNEIIISNVGLVGCLATEIGLLKGVTVFDVSFNRLSGSLPESDCSDHHFINGSGKNLTSSQMKRGWLKKVQQEWSILEKDLPETIYVRSYEERMDLLRAAIVGAPGTPYHDNLFFFDIFLPPEYPHEPPLVHYHSCGLRVNPNLYESGKVCLSLLNTWTGSGSEVWNPGSSTILQVLLSLQALVLNEKPYFNEAGYDKQIGRAEGEKNSVSYNENAFLVSCKSMMYLLCKPPKHFEALVEEHFSRHGKYILQACNAYMEGIPVGCAFGHTKDEQETQKGSSTGFKIMLAKLLPKLVEAFSDNGITCSIC